MQKILNKLRRVEDPPHGAYTQKIFRGIVERERGRADRNSHLFSLVEFKVPNVSRRCAVTRRLVKELTRRVRFTDVTGCLDQKHIGLLLPETKRDGARKIAQDVSSRLASEGQPVPFEVFTYPAEEVAHKEGDQDQNQMLLPEVGLPPSTESMPSPGEGFHTIDNVAKYSASPLPWWKRLVDIVGALAALLVLSPVLLVITVFIKLASPGPVFYGQERVGYLGQKFTCWKFRTMHHAADTHVHEEHFKTLMDSDQPMQKLDGRQDTRIIPFGHFLRASGLDELPQLLNVVRGEMSLIGPRPCIEYERQGFHTWQHSRFNTIPGLTGLWQVNGKNRTTFSQMMRMDVSYSRKKSFGGDLLIIVKTIPAVFSQLLDQYILRKPKTKTQPAGTPAPPSPATETHPGSAHPLEQN